MTLTIVQRSFKVTWTLHSIHRYR